MLGLTGLQKKFLKNNWKWFGNSLADLCAHTFVVWGKWGGLLRHRVVTITRKLEGE